MSKDRFWETVPLEEMDKAQWESLCDGCGKCCLLKLEDEDTGEYFFTDVACRLFDAETCRCGDYPRRQLRVPDCVVLDTRNVGQLKWMPSTCAYRLLAEGETLPWWHPLETGGQDAMHAAGMSARMRVLSEDDVSEDDLVDRIVDWAG